MVPMPGTAVAAMRDRNGWAVHRRRSARRVQCMAWCAALLIAPAANLLGQAQRDVDEYRVKAAFVYRFPQFVTWPPSATTGSATLDLCIARPSPFGSELEQLVQGEMVDGRGLRVREIAGPDALTGCHALFVGKDAAAARQVLQAAVGRHILTVGESDRFLNDGGIIVLRVINRRVRFEVDAVNARKSGLRIEAQLLNLAVAVRGGPS
jgi:hypothetical protein